jgi:hypothetical protein
MTKLDNEYFISFVIVPEIILKLAIKLDHSTHWFRTNITSALEILNYFHQPRAKPFQPSGRCVRPFSSPRVPAL